MPGSSAAASRIRVRKTPFISLFRTTPPATVCPNFYVLSHANGCVFAPRCDYCYLKSSLWHLKGSEAFGNIDEMEAEIEGWIARDGLESYILNAGNLSDSLAFEGIRPLASRLVEAFRRAEAASRRHTLLLVTKGGVKDCGAILGTAPCTNVIISFSVNCRAAAAQYERGAPPVDERMRAARLLARAGWRVRIRIDPMLAGLDYDELIDQVRSLAPERVTLGCLRAEPHLLRLVNHGMFAALKRPPDGKGLARYPIGDRLALYRRAARGLRGVSSMGLCEETGDVWEALGLDAEARSCNCCE